MDPTAPERIGLCLSGGGFRASFFALGALRYLAESQALERVVAVSAVSGGSIAAAAVADRWTDYQAAGGGAEAFLCAIDEPFRAKVTETSVRRGWIARSVVAVLPIYGRDDAYASALQTLYEHDQVAELTHHPEFIFTATDLATGRAFRIAPAYIGSYDYGYIEPTPTGVSLGTAVAASAAFPPSMTIVRLKTRGLPFPELAPKVLSLVDGGVYDNLGAQWFQGWLADAKRPQAATKPDVTILVDASGLMGFADKRFSALGALKREQSIQYQQSLNARRRPVEGLDRQDPYISVQSDPRRDKHPVDPDHQLPSELVAPLATLRTDLDRFTREEADLLSYHAYWTLHARLRQFQPALAMAAPSWNAFANLSPERTAELRRAMELGSHRFFRGIRRRLPWPRT